jgi:hypothetical protein
MPRAGGADGPADWDGSGGLRRKEAADAYATGCGAARTDVDGAPVASVTAPEGPPWEVRSYCGRGDPCGASKPERQEREQATERAAELSRELVAIANAGPIRAIR